MISALVLSPSLRAAQPHPRASEAVARSLGALVRAAVEGVLRDVTIIGPSGDDLAALADHAGCAFVETDSTKEGLVRAVAQMRANILFVLEGGYAPPSGFAQEVGDLLLDAANFRGALLRVAPDTLVTRLAPGLARPVGALALRNDIRSAAPRDLADLIRRLKIRRAMSVQAQQVV
jgi:hypothetical protein